MPALPEPVGAATPELTAQAGDIAIAAFYAMPIVAFLLDRDCQVVMHTRRAARVYNHATAHPSADLRGVPFSTLTHLGAADLQRALRASLSSGQVTLQMQDAHRIKVPKDVTFHLSLMRVDGVRAQLYMLSQDHLSASAAALQTAHLMRQKETDRGQHLKAHITSLQHSVLSMETFANAASHDLRSPINALAALLDIFGTSFRSDLPDEAQTYLEHMKRSVTQMEALTSKLLTHAQSAAAPLEMIRVRLSDVVAEVLAQLADECARSDAEITQSGPDVEFEAEPTLLQLLLVNVVSNALKHGAPGRPLRVALDTRRDGGGVTLSISDTGTGFEPSQANAIFAPFHQLKPGSQGSGVGLATCAEICRRHDWNISARSDGQTGAAFDIHIPVVTAFHVASI